ncbi:outer membrane lipid asymmetry maintenance protein MlaD [Oceanibacterium hippocampi]|uniref:Putative phospholipid ABC transporter-binding protein MlaD n=1 Tax=Oceanibacterium hippocampi TaxID=745714 RepID=A0A1Y5SUN2_9PROT|nr:outer membrane lipid asymmetry maintenance protein MlaD [Oceanibacterium hippocampi]SLN48829.1 putative phospholipid ABC transporter-binding protein MlaD [Oceanibacterium hippocampi]
MGSHVVETVIGAIVLAVAAVFMVFAYRTADLGGPGNAIHLTAKFDRVDGLSVGSDVRVSGIKVGTIVGQDLDPKSYLAVVRMNVDADVGLPEDTAAKIASESLLGGAYLALEPGGAEDMLKDGDEIQFTQGSVSIMDLIGQAIFGGAGGEATKDGAAAPAD